MSIFSPIESGFEDLGNAISGVGSTIGNAIANTAVSFGENAWNYAIIAGKGVASAGRIVGSGIVTFGKDAASFSLSVGGTAFNWVKTSAYDVANWAKAGAGIVANFAANAFDKVRDGMKAAWDAIKDLLTSTLDELLEPSTAARDVAYFALSATALGYEQMAKRANMTIAVVIKPQAGMLFNLTYDVGLYVDPSGGWGFLKLANWQQVQSLDTANLSLSAGISVTLHLICVFGTRQRYSGKRHFPIGVEAKFGAFSVGAGVLIDTDLSFLGFQLSVGIGLDLSPPAGQPQAPPKPKFSLGGQAIDMSELAQQLGSSGPVYDAAARAAQNPGLAAILCTTATAATMTPFVPRFYGYLRMPAYGNQLMVPNGNGLVPMAAAPSGTNACFRLVAGLADPSGVSIECLGSDGYPFYVKADSNGAVFARYDGSDAFKAAATFTLEQGLADPQGVAFCCKATPTLYLAVSTVLVDMVLPSPILVAQTRDSSVTFARQATFRLDPQPLPTNQTAVLRPGDTLRLGDWRRSADGRYFLFLDPEGVLQAGCGSGPSDSRATPLGSPGTGRLSLGWPNPVPLAADPTLAVTLPLRGLPYLWHGSSATDPAGKLGEMTLYGSPGDLFITITDGGRIAAFQGYPDRCGELLFASNTGPICWATERKSLAIKGPGGRFVRCVPVEVDGRGLLHGDSTVFGPFETFELATQYDGKFQFRSLTGYYVSANRGAANSLSVDAEVAQRYESFTSEPFADGSVALRSATTGLLWGVDTSGNVMINGQNGDPQTRFTLVPLERNLAAETGRPFTIQSKLSGLRLTITGWQSQMAPVVQLGETGGRNQSFTLVAAGEGIYSFAAQHSGQYFDLLYANQSAGTPLIQYPSNGGTNQQFRLLPNADGTYCIVPVHSGLFLEVAGASLVNGGTIVQSLPTGGDAQRFFIRPEQPLVTRALVAAIKGPAPMRSFYQERQGQSTWLDGWLDAGDVRMAGDFLGIGRAQLLAINRGGSGGKVMLADFGSGQETGRPLYYEVYGESPWLNGWLDDNDWQLCGDFMGRGRKQLLLLNRGGADGRLAIVELTPLGQSWLYSERWGQSHLFDGWHDDNDRWYVGDFMGRGHDQLLCLNRTPGGGKVMVVDFASGTPQVPFWETWGQSDWLNGWFDDAVNSYIGDFLGLGHAQLLMIDSRNANIHIGDLSTGQGIVRVATSGSPLLSGWLDAGDVQVVGDFAGLGHAQLLCANRQPWSNGKLMAVEFLSNGQLVVRYLEMWGQRTCFDGLLEPADLVHAADFLGVGSGRTQVLVMSPNVKSVPQPALAGSSGDSAVGVGLDILANLRAGDQHFVSVAAAYNSNNPIDGIVLQLNPPIAGLSLEYMAHVSNVGDVAWCPEGRFCGTRSQGNAIEGFAVRLTGTAKDQYTVSYAANGQVVADGAYAGTRGQGLPVRSVRVVVSRRRTV